MRNIVVEETCPITATKQNQGTGTTIFVPKTDELIDCDTLQAAAEEKLARVI